MVKPRRERAHGTYGRYFKDKCRCEECVTYQRARVARNRADRLAAGSLSHGRRSAYDAGCRCDDCTLARLTAYRRLEEYPDVQRPRTERLLTLARRTGRL